MDDAAEKVLIAQAQAGDRVALGQLLQAHQRRLFNVCLRMVSHTDDAAELTQDAMVHIVQSLGSFRGDAKFTTWMTRIAMNLSLSHLRKRKLRQTQPLDPRKLEPQQFSAAGTSEGEPKVGWGVEQKEEHARLQQAIAQLDDDQRAVLVLRDLEELDYLQIAHTLELPVGTVKSRLFRARLALRESMLAQEARGKRDDGALHLTQQPEADGLRNPNRG